MNVTSLPCENCSHAVVCVLRPGLIETVRRFDPPSPKIPPVLADAIRITASVEVSCAHHAPVREPLTGDRLAALGHAPPASRPAADIPSDGMGPEETDRQPTEAPAAIGERPSHQRPSSGVDGASPPAPRLTPRQQQYLDAIRRNDGNLTAAARDVGLANSGGLHTALAALRERGEVPADIEELLAARAVARTVRVLPPIQTAPMPAEMAAGLSRNDTHRERARAKAEETWRSTHPIEDDAPAPDAEATL